MNMISENNPAGRTATASEDLTLTEAEQSLGALLRRPYQAMVDQVYGYLAQSGFADIRPAHGAVFRHILPGGSRATDLADEAQMTKQSMSYLIDGLRQGGYVEMRSDPSDGRAKLVHLTPLGAFVQRSALERSRQFERELGDAIGHDQMRELRTLLERVSQHLAQQELGK